MTAEQYLNQIKKIDAIIINKLDEYKRWVDIAEGMGGFSVGDKVQSSRNLQQIPNAIGRYVDIDKEIEDLKKKRQAIIRTLERLPPIEYKILYDLFVKDEDCGLKELAYHFKKSYSWVKKRKNKGLMMVQDILDNE